MYSVQRIPVIVLLLLLQVVVICRSHVVLTFPPARRYALDFLDSVRLPHSMCGMPKGLGPTTSLLAGSKINITWNLAYPHKGGYKLEILDAFERPVMDLTPVIKDNKFLSYNKYAQNHEIGLPKDFECRNCTVRLLREAIEMGPDFLIRSCADIDIIKNNYQEDCSKNGLLQNGKCNCRIPFVGHRCQYENECGQDSDCGQHGRCLLVDPTNYPKKQCFCELGWFGRQCNKESIVKSKPLVLSGYNRQDLSHNAKLYWKILKDSEEIEIIVTAKTLSYIAIGWRPKDIGVECKRFPDLQNPTLAKSEIRKGKELVLTELSSTPQHESTTKATEAVETSTSRTSVMSTKEPTSTSKATTAANSPNVRFPTRKINPLVRRFTTPRTSPSTTSTSARTESISSNPSTISSPTSAKELTTNKASDTPLMLIEVRSESSIQEDIQDEGASENEENIDSENQSSMSIEKEENYVPSDENVSAYSKKSSSTVNDMDTAASEEIMSNVQVKSYGLDVGKSKREVQQQILTEENPYYPAFPLHPMDCTDMIIGTVKENYSHIRDYYSRDMSSPRLDSFWGGKDDITSAAGFESDGETVISFRKKLAAQDMTDHSITDSTMHVIWAMGQTENRNAASKESVDPFYTLDVLLYHGNEDQRGMTAINFYNTDTAFQENTTSKPCRSEWKFPSKCTLDDCEYKATWEYSNETDDISFTVFTNHTSSWTGIGFSNDTKMNNSDVIIGWVNDNGKYFMMDMWINGYSAPILDSKQDIEFERGEKNQSGTILMFKRKRITGDVNDLAFTKSECLYMIFPYHGGAYNSVNKKIQMHRKTPAISPKRICMTECEDMNDIKAETPDAILNVFNNYPSTMESISSPVTTKQTLTLIIRLPLEDANFTANEEIQNAAKSTMQSEVHSVLKDVDGYKNVVVSNVSRDPNATNWLLAAMKIEVQSMMEASNNRTLEYVIRSSVAEGKIGSLEVDPNFIHLQVPEGWSQATIIDPTAVDYGWPQATTIESTSVDYVNTASSNLIPIYVIITAVIILGLLIMIQIICNVRNYMKTKNTRISKEKLFANSGWKDYSTTASSNYSYEPFSSNNHEENSGKVSKIPLGGSNSESTKYHADHHNNHHRNSSGGAPSLQQSQSSHENGKGHYSRRSESLPHPSIPSSQSAMRGGSYATHNRALKNNSPKTAMELQPDFYFMPSQRRYKGEVVRVYVDYDNPNLSA